jgi:hypothetical protein
MRISLLFAAAIASTASCQSIPLAPQGVTTIKSKAVDGASISYKEVSLACRVYCTWQTVTNTFPTRLPSVRLRQE